MPQDPYGPEPQPDLKALNSLNPKPKTLTTLHPERKQKPNLTGQTPQQNP